MSITCKNDNGTIVVKVTGEINVLNAGEFEQDAIFALKNNSCPLTIDFTELNYISSSGLSVIIAVAKEVKRQKRKMNIVLADGFVKDIIHKTGLAPFLEISAKS
ncbi:MAG: STAS domain-containing protein [Lentisphaerota bacterium]